MTDPISRRALLARGAAALAVLALPDRLFGSAAGIPLLVYKDPSCGCCHNWAEIMKRSGFEVSVRDTQDMASIKKRYQVGPRLVSCHTAVAAGYVVEGHVPADLIKKMLREKPKARGIAVPGMPVGSPGMEGSPKEAYEVLLFDAAGTTTVYARR